MSLQPVDLSGYLATPNEAELELRRLFRPNWPLVIFDIGACEGEDSVRYAHAYRNAKIYTFEPLPSNQTLVRQNFERHSVRNAELIPVALSNAIGSASFHVSSGRPPELFAGTDWNYGNKSSSLLAPANPDPMYGWIEFKETITVPTSTLDAFCHERNIKHIDFVHMDVQGAEHLVLSGATAMLPNISSIWLEVSDQELYRGQRLRMEMETLLKTHGFKLAFEVRRQIEGDQLYIKPGSRGAARYFFAQRVRRLAQDARRLAGSAKRRVQRVLS